MFLKCRVISKLGGRRSTSDEASDDFKPISDIDVVVILFSAL